MSHAVSNWAWRQKVGKARLKLVLVKLADQANDDGVCWPSVRTLADQTEMSRSAVDRALKELQELGVLRVEQRQRNPGQRRSNYYILGRPTQAGQPSSHPGGQGSSHPGGTEPSVEPQLLDPSGLSASPPARTQVREAWLAAPGMIQHREEYFRDDAVRYRIDKAVRKYGAEDVVAAIQAYSEVLASDDHYFKHRWTLADFLQRGLDRFVPEADPRRVFLRERGDDVRKDDDDGLDAYDR